MRTGNEFERRQLRDDMLEEDIVGVCLQHLQRPLCVMHEAAINLLRALASDAFLGDKVSPSVAADIIESVCLFALAGPDHVVSQMLDPMTAWQSLVFTNADGKIPTDKLAEYAPDYYSMAQDYALAAAHSLMGVFPTPSRRFCLEILKKKPQIVELLLDCAALDRYPRNPMAHFRTKACEVLAILLQWPSHIVPGVPTPLDKAFKAQEWKAMLQMMAIFTSRTNWLDKLIEVWMRVQDEDMEQVQGYVTNLGPTGPVESSTPEG